MQRQRSISLSSLDSEMEIELHGKSCTRPVGVASRACRSQASTHSLNEADLVQVMDAHIEKFLICLVCNEVYCKFFFNRANIRR